MTPVSAPVSITPAGTPAQRPSSAAVASGAAAVASGAVGTASVVPASPVSIVVPQTGSNPAVDAPTLAAPIMATTVMTATTTTTTTTTTANTTHTTSAVHVDAHSWPTLNGCKPNPGSDDWRALERRAFSLRLRGPFGEIDG